MTPAEKAEKKFKLDKWNDKKFDYHSTKEYRQKWMVKRGEVYFVDLGENIGCEINKPRPVVVIQSDIYGASSPLFTCAVITSKSPKIPDSHILIKNKYPYVDNGKTKNLKGIINLTQIRTISKERLLFKDPICTLTTEMDEVDEKLIKTLGLTNIIKKKDKIITSLKGKVEYLKGVIDKK